MEYLAKLVEYFSRTMHYAFIKAVSGNEKKNEIIFCVALNFSYLCTIKP